MPCDWPGFWNLLKKIKNSLYQPGEKNNKLWISFFFQSLPLPVLE